MLRMYNSAFGESCSPVKMIEFLESQGEDEFFSSDLFSQFTLPAERRLEILQRCEESNRRVATEFLGREDGVLFREPWPVPDEPYQAYGGLVTEKLVPILLHLLQKQDERILELDHRLYRFEHETQRAIAATPAGGIVDRLKQRVKIWRCRGENSRKRRRVPRLRLRERLDVCHGTPRQSGQIVAALEDRNESAAGVRASHFQQQTRQIAEILVGQFHSAQRVVVPRVKTGRQDHKVGLEAAHGGGASFHRTRR